MISEKSKLTMLIFLQNASRNLGKLALVGLIFSIFFWFSCKEEEPLIPVPEPPVPQAPAYCSFIDQTILNLETQVSQGDIVIGVENQDTLIQVLYDNGDMITICSDSLLSFEVDSSAFNLTILLADSTSFSDFYYIEDFSIEIQTMLNPSGYAPLAAEMNITSELEGYVKIKVLGQDGSYSDIDKTFTDINTVHQIPILGLYINYENKVVIEYLTGNEFLLYSDTLTIQTEPTDLNLPEVFVDISDVENMVPGFQLISHLNLDPDVPFMIDPFGKVRFLFDWRNHPQLQFLYYDVGMERLQNGNYYFGSKASDKIFEVDIYGNIVNDWPLLGYDFHHNVYEKSGGNFLITAEEDDSEHIDFGYTKEDKILELDRNTGSLTKLWDVRYILDERRDAFFDFGNDYLKDWAHLNAVVYDEMDNTIIFSARHQSSLCKVNYNDEIQWILSPRTDFGTNRLGVNLEPYYLTAVDENGIAYDENVQNGNANIEEFEWPWKQHAVKVIGENRIICFDNGNARNFGNSPSVYSRAVIYNIDPVNMTVSQEWTYGRERSWETFSACCSDVDFIEEHNRVIFSPGYNTDNWNGNGGRVIEIDYDTKEEIFEARVNSGGVTQHRTERLTIYPE